MIELLQLLALPLAACLILAGIHCYLGIHVLARGVIFVDLALAQLAALGATLALVTGHELHGPYAYACSLALTVVGAALFALARDQEGAVPQEALIGITYAVASALAILVLERSPHGQEEVKSILVGSILFVTKRDVVKLAIAYAIIGAFHYAFRERFLLISADPDAARARGWHLKAWDFLFYLSFGLVITSSVRIAGVLLVFSYLVVPSACGVLMASGVRRRLMIGWTVGLFGSVLGLAASARWDLPTGAAVVATLGAIMVITLVIARIRSRSRRALPA